MRKTKPYLMFLLFLLVSAKTSALPKKESASVVSFDDVKWGHLNPKRGDKSPGAAELWGDRTKNTPTGMLVKFNKGFSSPPHIHNVSYRGVVIEGLIHNDDPSAEKMWLNKGSFWTQPRGQNHITAANAETNLIYLEIDSGPYLVEPSKKRFDDGERPINLHSSNLVWLGHEQLNFIESDKIKVAHLWKSSNTTPGLTGYLIKISAGFNGVISTNATEFRAVIIKNGVTYVVSEPKKLKQLQPGSYFSSSGIHRHNISVLEESMLYIRANGAFKISS